MLLKSNYKIIISFGVTLILLVSMGSWLVRLYLSSESFAGKLESIAQKSLGAELKLAHGLRVDSFLPLLVIQIPKLSVRQSQSDKSLKLRLDNIRFTLPFSQLVSLGKDDFSISIDKVNAIVNELKEGESSTQTEQQFDTDALKEYLGMLHGYKGHVDIHNSNILYRPLVGQSKQFEVTDIRVSADSELLDLSGNYQFTKRIKQAIKLQFSHLKNNNSLGVKAMFEAKNGIDLYSKPLLLSGQVVVSDQIVVEDIELNYGPNKLEINASIDERNNVVKGVVALKRLELSDILQIQNNADGESTDIFDNQELGIDKFSKADVDITLELGAVRYHNKPIVSGIIRTVIKNDNLDINSESLRILGAPAKLDLLGTSFADQPAFEFETGIDRLKLRRFHFDQERGGEPIFTSGLSNLDIQLNFSGKSSQEMASSLSGHINYATSASELTIAAVKFVDKSLLSYTSVGFSEKEKEKSKDKTNKRKHENLPFYCINAHMALDNGYGVADRTIVIETRDNILDSTAYVDFHKESLGITFEAETKRFIDWSPLSLAKYLEIDGSLSAPNFTLNKTEATKKGLVTAASFVLGPVPILAYSAIEASRKYAKGKPECLPYIPSPTETEG